jgi:hypothetical protein
MKNIERVIEQFPLLLKEFSKELLNAWQVSVSRQFRDKDDKIFNNSDRLRSGTKKTNLRGDLSRNAKPEVKDGKAILTWETDKPYAGIQNRGGFIKAKPTTNSRGKKTYKMAQYFWAKSFEADVKRKRELYKRIALSVEKKGGVNIKGKHYLENSLKDFEQTQLQRVVQEFFNNIAKVWNAN